MVEVELKKWGNSIGIVLPKEYVDKNHLKANDKVIINIVKEADLSKIYGSLKRSKGLSGQDLKDSARKEW